MAKPNYKRRYPGMPKAFYELLDYYGSDVTNAELDLDKITDCMDRAAFPDKLSASVTKVFKLQDSKPKKFDKVLGKTFDKAINDYIDWRDEQRPVDAKVVATKPRKVEPFSSDEDEDEEDEEEDKVTTVTDQDDKDDGFDDDDDDDFDDDDDDDFDDDEDEDEDDE